MKLVQKQRSGSRVIKRYDRPKSPYRRLLDCSSLEESVKQRLRQEHRKLRPLQLKKDIAQLQDRLYRLARNKYSPASGPLPAGELASVGEVPTG
jgi:gluconate kinase